MQMRSGCYRLAAAVAAVAGAGGKSNTQKHKDRFVK